jgi:2-polyprenyl-6-methoxyphenol hydroxylase-like FAD-dependent oxidoreductase
LTTFLSGKKWCKKKIMKHILIIGGGIGGLCTAIALKRKGFQPKVYERVPQLKGLGAGLVLAANAITALKDIGIDQEVLAKGNFFETGGVYDQNGKVISANITPEIIEKYGLTSASIHRADLHEILIRLLGEAHIETGKVCKEVRQDGEKVVALFEDGTSAEGDALIAADGIHSGVRNFILPEIKTRYSGYTCWRGVLEVEPTQYDLTRFSETWGLNGRFGIVPLVGNRIYWFATKNAPENDPQMANWQGKELWENFKDYHDPIPQLIRETKGEHIIWNDIIDIKPMDHFAFGRILLMGDAAHATTPNMGQGACMAIEDAATVANCLAKHEDPIEAFIAFEKLRIKRTTQIVNRSWSFGRLGQLESPFLSKLRNTMLRMIPSSMTEKQVGKMYEVNLG